MDRSLYLAAVEGNIAVLTQNRGKLEDQLTPNKNTVLHIASESGKTECVKEILSMHPSLLWVVNSRDETALHLAAKDGHLSVVEALIASAESPLDQVNIERGGVRAIRDMLRMINKNKDTALHEAARFNHVDVVQKLLEKEDPNYPQPANNVGETPLYLAAHRGYHNLVSTILQTFPTATYGGPNGRTALHGAVMFDGQECVQNLIEWKATLIKETDVNGQTPLHYAARIGLLFRAIQLLSSDQSAGYVADKDDENTALHIAASRDHIDVIEELMIHCPDSCEMINKKGQNILHVAGEYKRVECIKYILRKYPLISSLADQKDVNGNTPLHQLAASNCFVPEFILHRRVDKETLNNQNSTPLDMAERESNVAFKLRREGATTLDWNGNNEDELKKLAERELEERKEEVEYAMKIAETHKVVAALIVTVTFAAGFTLPGGYNSDKGSNQGFAVLTREAAFKAFIVTDTLALLCSTVALVIYVILADNDPRDKLMEYYAAAAMLLLVAIGAMIVAFTTGTYAVLSHSSGLSIATTVVGSSFFLIYFALLVTSP